MNRNDNIVLNKVIINLFSVYALIICLSLYTSNGQNLMDMKLLNTSHDAVLKNPLNMENIRVNLMQIEKLKAEGDLNMTSKEYELFQDNLRKIRENSELELKMKEEMKNRSEKGNLSGTLLTIFDKISGQIPCQK